MSPSEDKSEAAAAEVKAEEDLTMAKTTSTVEPLREEETTIMAAPLREEEPR